MVVDPAVPVVVDAVTGNLTGVRPDVRRQIGVVVGDAGVRHRDHDAAATRRRVPGLRRVDVCVHNTAVLTDVVQAPELAARETRIVRCRRRAEDQVRLGVEDIASAFECLHRSEDTLAAAQPSEHQARNEQLADESRVLGAKRRIPCGGSDAGSKAHEHFTRHKAIGDVANVVAPHGLLHPGLRGRADGERRNEGGAERENDHREPRS